MSASHFQLALLAILFPVAVSRSVAADLEPVHVSGDGKGFVLASGKPFTPWGFNYDHDGPGRLIEDYWDDEWPMIVEDFREMKELGGNVVRIHLQFGKFMETAEEPNRHSLEQLARLVRLAEQVGLYLDLTGLGCYHKKDVPRWYDELGEKERWKAQAAFWEAIAKTCADSPAVFCYDLMNEPVVGGEKKRDDWLGPAFAGKHFVQFIVLETKGRPRHEIARQWTSQLVAAIRKHDRKHLVTVGLVPWSLDRPGLTSGFIPEKIADDLDFIAMHVYPETGKVDEAMETLRGFAIGKPVVIEETFPLKCSTDEMERFIDESRSVASGWISFYWGKTPEEYRKGGTIGDAIMASWIELFPEKMTQATYTNPVGATPLHVGDPFVLQHDGQYYLFGTNAPNKGFKCLVSKDLVSWQEKGWAYRQTPQSWARSHYWAPEVKQYRGRFYMTYSALNKAGNPPRLLIALAVSDRPEGPYEDLHAPWFDFGYSAIDGHIFVDDDGKPYLYFSRNGVQDGYSFGVNYGVALADDLSKPVGEPVKLTEADQPWEKVRYEENRCNEGAFVLKHGGRYYMTYSANHTGFPHYGIGYATAARPLGPWVKAEENPIAATDLDIGVSGPGHSCFTRSPDGKEMFIVYHSHADPQKPSADRVVNIDRIRFDDSGKLGIVGPTRSPQPKPSGCK